MCGQNQKCSIQTSDACDSETCKCGSNEECEAAICLSGTCEGNCVHEFVATNMETNANLSKIYIDWQRYFLHFKS